MLSPNELKDGMTFILRLADAAGAPRQWAATLRGDAARHWYEIDRRSDWEALRAEGAAVFRDRVTEAQAEKIRRSRRCIVIHTTAVKPEEIERPRATAAGPLQPGWETDGGSVAPQASGR